MNRRGILKALFLAPAAVAVAPAVAAAFPREERAAHLTGGQTASAIAGQGALATQYLNGQGCIWDIRGEHIYLDTSRIDSLLPGECSPGAFKPAPRG